MATLLSPGGGAQKQKAPEGYTLVWSDEFKGKEGSLPDASKWTYDIGGSGWGNHELEFYTNRAENARIEDGKLVITVRQEPYTGPDGAKFNYTSARLKTEGLFSQAYGRFEARIKLPAGQGIWPAFWMLGENIPSAGWPKCGEIDIMENVGKEPGINHGSLRGPSSTNATSDQTATITFPAGQKLSDDVHVYTVEWEPGTVRFYLDSNLYATFSAGTVARRRHLGIRSSIFPDPQCGRWRRLAGLAQYRDHVSAEDAGGLRARVQAQDLT